MAKVKAKSRAKAKKKINAAPAKAARAAPAPVVVTPVEPPKQKLAVIQINAKYLRAMRHIAAKHDIRYYLNGVHFSATKAGGKFYVATDGHRIAVIQEAWSAHEEPQDVALIIPRAVAEKATPMLDKAPTAILKQVDAWTWTLDGKDGIAQTFKAIDGKFPAWQRVMPDTVSGNVGAYNWTYLHEFNLLAKEAFGNVWSVSLQHNGDGAGIVTCNSQSFLGLVMPMRETAGSVPLWALDIQKANIARKAKEKFEAEQRASNAEVMAEAA